MKPWNEDKDFLKRVAENAKDSIRIERDGHPISREMHFVCGLYFLSNAEKDVGKLIEAERRFHISVLFMPSDPIGHIWLGESILKRAECTHDNKAYKEALTRFSEGLDLFPSNFLKKDNELVKSAISRIEYIKNHLLSEKMESKREEAKNLRRLSSEFLLDKIKKD